MEKKKIIIRKNSGMGFRGRIIEFKPSEMENGTSAMKQENRAMVSLKTRIRGILHTMEQRISKIIGK